MTSSVHAAAPRNAERFRQRWFNTQIDSGTTARNEPSRARTNAQSTVRFVVTADEDISPFVATRDIRFDPGDAIVLYTDGVTEAESPDGELFGTERLCRSVRAHGHGNAEEIVHGVIDDVIAHIGTQKIHDDITLVVMRHR